MEFNDNKPIYRQIIDYCFASIMAGNWIPDARVPSVRELAVTLAVNTHTVLKAFEFMQAHGIIYPKRGMGYYLASDAKDLINVTRREEFFSDTLPSVFAEMRMLGIDIDDIVTKWKTT